MDDSIEEELKQRLYQITGSFVYESVTKEMMDLLEEKLLSVIREYGAIGLITGTPALELKVPDGYSGSKPPTCDILLIDLYSTTPT